MNRVLQSPDVSGKSSYFLCSGVLLKPLFFVQLSLNCIWSLEITWPVPPV